ncbi:NDR1/HIN1-like protein 10 [Cannabis sativa]|uniref:NDR1/HIN1-like protein 10 n=1 Tax=Cannabis sativa TaxID=3483 RepID=UPI0029CA73CB|nr:NDR1/HIN1-like protein 10 [Cannabis sativa]
MTTSGPASAGCLCCCLIISWIIKIIITISIVIGLALLFFWIIVNPHKMKIQIGEASLAQFNFTTTNDTLYYDLNFDVAIQNPNKMMGFFYDMVVVASDQENNYVHSKWEVFYQGRKTTTTMLYNFAGKRELYFGDSNERSRFIKRFEEEKKRGMFVINVKIEDFRVRVRLGKIRIGVFQPKVRCDPLNNVALLSDHNMGKKATQNSVECQVQFKATSIMEPLD